MELWRDIPGWEGYYQVSNHGRVRSVTRVIRGATYKGKLLKQVADKDRRMRVNLSKDSKVHLQVVAALVAKTFIGPRPDGAEVRHLDGNPMNNVATNLAYGSKSLNTFDSIRHGTHNNARKTHCKHGHELSGDNLIMLSGNRRWCRTCKRDAAARYRANRKKELLK